MSDALDWSRGPRDTTLHFAGAALGSGECKKYRNMKPILRETGPSLNETHTVYILPRPTLTALRINVRKHTETEP